MAVWWCLALVAGLALAGCPETKRAPRIGIAPSHITTSPNVLFEEGADWGNASSAVDLYKYYGVQLVPAVDWATDLDVESFVRFCNKHTISIGCEFGSFEAQDGHVKPDAVRMAIEQMQPIFDAGGRVDSIHLDGMEPRLLGVMGQKEKLTLEQIATYAPVFFKGIHARYPDVRIGIITNLPNWDYTEDLAGYNGHWTAQTGHTYAEVLDAVYTSLVASGEKPAFLEVDMPYNYYIETHDREGGRPVHNTAKLRAISKWCDQRNVDLHLIVNAEPRDGTAKQFHELTLQYIRDVKAAGIEPDLFLIQSWYKQPQQHLPASLPDTFLYTAGACIQQIRKSAAD